MRRDKYHLLVQASLLLLSLMAHLIKIKHVYVVTFQDKPTTKYITLSDVQMSFKITRSQALNIHFHCVDTNGLPF